MGRSGGWAGVAADRGGWIANVSPEGNVYVGVPGVGWAGCDESGMPATRAVGRLAMHRLAAFRHRSPRGQLEVRLLPVEVQRLVDSRRAVGEADRMRFDGAVRRQRRS